MQISSIPHEFIWAIWLLPLAAFALIAPLIRPLPGRGEPASYISIGAISISLVLSLWLLFSVWQAPDHQILLTGFNWLTIAGGPTLNFGMLLDPLSAVMLAVVCSVSLLVQIYSRAYMHSDPGYLRYYAFISVFTASMLGLVVSSNLAMTFFFWELVGLSSYLLIGFWFHRPAAATAAKKAFLVTRVGDVGFLAGILLLYAHTGTLDVLQIRDLAATGAIAGWVMTWGAIGLFVGAMGKSGQFPLHVWLPDAMEGPTPVSALIHAATMVAAGVFLVARMYPLFEAAPHALTVVGWVGAFTAVFAGTMGLVMNDIKRVLAYSTISQLGLMFLGLATGGVWVGVFYLFNHAFFKALLFLAAGSVNHATGTFDLKLMGGLGKKIPLTFACFVPAALSLAGIWPLAGFFSKEGVLSAAIDKQPVLFAFAIATTFLTAFYIFRVVFLVFGGEPRGNGEHKAHESPKLMLVPMFVLAVAAVASGWLNANGGFERWLSGSDLHGFWEGIIGMVAHPLALISLLVALLGILVAYALYIPIWVSPKQVKWFFRSLYAIFTRKYGMDDLYEKYISRNLLLNGIFAAIEWLDYMVIDRVGNAIGGFTTQVGAIAKKVQTGQLQLYGLAAVGGSIIIVIVFLLVRG
jgi:NADH-quinone oxidoreductase subunit L